MMNCRKCGSTDVTLHRIADTKTKKKSGWKYWLLGGWFIDFFMTFVLGFIFLIPRIILRKKPKVETKVYTEAVCQNCGNVWKVK